jgi:NADPH:quinone reductase-like Zn-dependent oxidoreductase
LAVMSSTAMRVIEVTRFGGPEVLTPATAPVPAAWPGQVVIDVTMADVLFLDTLIRSGRATDQHRRDPAHGVLSQKPAGPGRRPRSLPQPLAKKSR